MPACWNGIQCSLRMSSLGVQISLPVPISRAQWAGMISCGEWCATPPSCLCSYSTMVMQRTLNAWIQGSSPCGSTKLFIRLMDSSQNNQYEKERGASQRSPL